MGIAKGLKLLLITLLLVGGSSSIAQNNKLNVLLNCDFCITDSLQKSMPFLNFTTEQDSANVSVKVLQTFSDKDTSIQMSITGLKAFKGVDDTLSYKVASQDSLQDKELQATLTIVLMRYLSHTTAKDQIIIENEAPNTNANTDDKWNNWVFEIGVEGDGEFEDLTKEYDLGGYINISRITEDWKIIIEGDYDRSESMYKIDGETVRGHSEWKEFHGLAVRSLSDHWSVGGWSNVENSIYNNYKLKIGVAPRIEYNFFPYSESSEHHLMIYYGPSFNYREYFETTIYGEDIEILGSNYMRIEYQTQQDWGYINFRLSGSHYFHDISKYHVQFRTSARFKITKGLSLYYGFQGTLYRDQLNLSNEGASKEDVLLRQKALASGYKYGIDLGISYSFGALNNNIVNPRLY